MVKLVSGPKIVRKAGRQKLRENHSFAFFRSFVLTDSLAKAITGEVNNYLSD